MLMKVEQFLKYHEVAEFVNRNDIKRENIVSINFDPRTGAYTLFFFY